MQDENSFALEIVGAESLGVRSLCCAVNWEDHRILIDPGLALGYFRHGRHPHPIQVAVGKRVRRRILTLMEQATDVVFSHFHGDHVPLKHANPFQLSLRTLPQRFQDLHARGNALRLADHVNTLILDHHLMRSQAGEAWLSELSQTAGRQVYCAADFMKRPRLLLEAWRDRLYKAFPVPDGWMDDYAQGTFDVEPFLESALSRGVIPPIDNRTDLKVAVPAIKMR